jgi:hypothetical protein
VSEFPRPPEGREVPPGGAAAGVGNVRLRGLVPLRRCASEPSGGAVALTPPTSAGEEGV